MKLLVVLAMVGVCLGDQHIQTLSSPTANDYDRGISILARTGGGYLLLGDLGGSGNILIAEMGNEGVREKSVRYEGTLNEYSNVIQSKSDEGTVIASSSQASLTSTQYLYLDKFTISTDHVWGVSVEGFGGALYVRRLIQNSQTRDYLLIGNAY